MLGAPPFVSSRFAAQLTQATIHDLAVMTALVGHLSRGHCTRHGSVLGQLSAAIA